MAWLFLLGAGLCEIVWAVAMKQSQGFENPKMAIIAYSFMGLSLWLLTHAMKTIPMGTAYASWTGIGAVGAVIAGVILFGESASMARLLSVVAIVGGIVGLYLTSPAKL